MLLLFRRAKVMRQPPRKGLMRKMTARICSILALLGLGLAAKGTSAYALPSFASQTGQPCPACHVGASGPQLTPLGRTFKIGGYTQQGGDGVAAQIPLSAMTLTSFNHAASGFTEG